MGKIVAVANQKGGTGKTTTAISMGAALKEKGYKVLLVDADDSGNPSLSKTMLDEINMNLTTLIINKAAGEEITDIIDTAIYSHNEGIDILPANSKLTLASHLLNSVDEENKRTALRDILEIVKNKYDYIILDAAPALNIMSVNVLTAADEVIIATQAQESSAAGVLEFLKTAAEVKQNSNRKLIVKGLLITMLDSRTNYNKNKASELAEKYTSLGMKVFETRIPRAIVAESFTENKGSILTYAPESKPAMAYRQFVNEYLEEA